MSCGRFGSSRFGTVIGDALLDRSGVQKTSEVSVSALAIAIEVEYLIELSNRFVAS